MGKLYKRAGSPYLWAWWYDSQGRRCRESTRTADRRVATLWLSAREAEAIRESAGVPTAKRVCLADAAAQFLDAHLPPVWSADWHYTVKHWWRSRIQPALGGPDVLVSAVTRATVEDARAAWLREVQPPTVNRLCAIGSGFYKWASDPDRRYALTNPFARWPKLREVKIVPPSVTEQDLARFLRALPAGIYRRGAAVALDTGMRLSEVRRVRPEDIRGDLVHVYKTKNGRARWLLLTPRALDALQAHEVEPGAAILGDLPTDTRKVIQRAQEAAGLARFTWRDLRHYALTRAARAGVLAHDLRGMAGWAGDESARYIHPEAEGMRPFVLAQRDRAVTKTGRSAKKRDKARDSHPRKNARTAARS